MNVFLLWHMRPLVELGPDAAGATDDKLCGVFSTPDAAQSARQVLIGFDGFRDFPDGFLIDEVTVDEMLWETGFVSLQPGE